MTVEAVTRAVVLLPAVLLGVLLGQRFFTEAMQPYYRRICLVLLVFLAGLSLVRSLL
jgi:uncharacterized membrane protein YfcA